VQTPFSPLLPALNIIFDSFSSIRGWTGSIFDSSLASLSFSQSAGFISSRLEFKEKEVPSNRDEAKEGRESTGYELALANSAEPSQMWGCDYTDESGCHLNF